jgi:hypothetical protein
MIPYNINQLDTFPFLLYIKEIIHGEVSVCGVDHYFGISAVKRVSPAESGQGYIATE